MSSTDKIRRSQEPIYLGSIAVFVFQLPNGQYILSQSSITEAIDKSGHYMSQFLNSKSPEALPFKGLTCHKYSVEGERATINAVPISVASAFWRYWDKKGNKKASAIVDACVIESIERRADKVFGLSKSEAEYNQQFSDNLKSFQPVLEPIYTSSESPYGTIVDPIRELTVEIKNGYGWVGNERIMEDWLILLASYCNSHPWRQIPQRSFWKTSTVSNRRFDLLLRPPVPLYRNRDHVVILTDLKSNYVDSGVVSDTCLTKAYPEIALRELPKSGIRFETLVFQMVSPCGITESGVDRLNDIRDLLTRKYGKKIFLDAIRLDDMIWNQIYPAIEQTYRDEDGSIGNQFLFVRDEILRLCGELCNPDIWVESQRALRVKTWNLLQVRGKLRLSGHG